MTPPEARRHWVISPDRMPLLVSRRRRRIMPPVKILRALGLRRGMTLIDAGCGPGFFALPACRVVGKYGRVLASDTSPAMLRELRKKSAEKNLETLRVKKSNDPEIPFENDSADMAMFGFVLHETGDVDGFLGEALRVLRPGGRLVVMEWHRRETGYGPPLWARIGPGEAKRMVRKAGFVVSRAWNFDEDTYFVVASNRNGKKGGSPFEGPAETVTRRRD